MGQPGNARVWQSLNPSKSLGLSMFLPPLQTILVETTWEFSPALGQSGMLLIDRLYIYLYIDGACCMFNSFSGSNPKISQDVNGRDPSHLALRAGHAPWHVGCHFHCSQQLSEECLMQPSPQYQFGKFLFKLPPFLWVFHPQTHQKKIVCNHGWVFCWALVFNRGHLHLFHLLTSSR